MCHSRLDKAAGKVEQEPLDIVPVLHALPPGDRGMRKAGYKEDKERNSDSRSRPRRYAQALDDGASAALVRPPGQAVPEPRPEAAQAADVTDAAEERRPVAGPVDAEADGEQREGGVGAVYGGEGLEDPLHGHPRAHGELPRGDVADSCEEGGVGEIRGLELRERRGEQ